jgi:hypothetical protein
VDVERPARASAGSCTWGGGGDAREILLEREARGDVARADDEVERVRERLVEVALRDDDVVRAELLDVLYLVLGRRERGDLGAERIREQDGVVALRTSSVFSSRSNRWREEEDARKRVLTRPPMPMMPTFLPGPVPLRMSGEKTVRPAQSMLAASSDAMPSGIGKTKSSFAMMPVEYPPCVRTPSGYSAFYTRRVSL